MTNIVNVNNYRKSYTGTVREKFDGGSTIYSWANARAVVTIDEGMDYPDLMDSSAVPENAVAGFVTGTITQSGVVKLDRGLDTWMNGNFGPRSANGKLTPMIVTIVPAGGVAPETLTGVYWNTLTLTAVFGTNGRVLAFQYEKTGYILDPKNVLGAAALAAGVNEGVAGVGISTFARAKTTNGAASNPTTYDGIRRVVLAFNNRYTPDPTAYPGHETDGIIAGYTPGIIMATAAFSQLQGCAQSLPYSGRTNPVTLKIPSGDGTVMGTLDMSLSYNGHGESFDPSEFATNSINYRLFGSSNVNGTGNAAYPFIMSVA